MESRRKTPLEIHEVEAHMCSSDLRIKILHGLPFFKDLSHEAIVEINKLFHNRHYAAGDTIYFNGDKATRLCVIASGSVKLLKHSADGQDILIDILKSGEFFGNLETFGETVYHETAEAQTNSCILEIGSENFRTILNKYPSTALTVLDIIAERLRIAHEMIRQLSAHSVEQRIAYTLLKLSKKLGEQKEVGLLIQIPLSRYDLAAMTGTTMETASRIMSQLQKQGIIRTGRQWVAITNYEKLKILAEIETE